MSYCRWSCDDFQCDLYCYEDVSGGWTTHVAGNRVIFKGELPPMPHWLDFVGVAQRHTLVRGMLREAERVPIELEHVGKSFNDETLEEFHARLLELRAIGYRFPDYVLEDVRDEIANKEKEHG